MFDRIRRHKGKIGIGAALIGGLATHELTKSPKPTEPTTEVGASHNRIAPTAHDHANRHVAERPAPANTELTDHVDATFVPNFEHMHFTTADVLDLNREHAPAVGHEQSGWNPAADVDQDIRERLDKDARAKLEYEDIASHLTITPGEDSIKFDSTDDYGGLHLEYQFNEPSDESPMWGVTGFKDGQISNITSAGNAPYQTEQELKNQILQLVKQAVYAEAKSYKTDEAQ